jgi:Ala-tRNA(Pro) deacylase
MPVKKLREFLDSQNIKYITIDHSPAYTAREVASSALVPRREFAKTVIVKLDGRNAMAVVPASRHVDLGKLAAVAGAQEAVLASEEEFQALFPGCEVGAMPPFGNLYEMDVFVDEILHDDDDIVFNAGSHIQVIRMSYDDYQALVKPTVGSFAIKE